MENDGKYDANYVGERTLPGCRQTCEFIFQPRGKKDSVLVKHCPLKVRSGGEKEEGVAEKGPKRNSGGAIFPG